MGHFEMRYYETYYYANVIHNVLRNKFDWQPSLKQWHKSQGDELFLRPFNKWSLFHNFCRFIIDSSISENSDDIEEDRLCHDKSARPWIDDALAHHEIEHDGFDKWLQEHNVKREEINKDTLYEYHQELLLGGEFRVLTTKMANELFTILFANRQLMEMFNCYVASVVSLLKVNEVGDEYKQHLKSDGVIHRSNIPEWVKRPVYYRERGKCAMCQKDLTGLLTLIDNKHYDHIVPLAVGGINDISNIQLLCEYCNLQKM